MREKIMKLATLIAPLMILGLGFVNNLDAEELNRRPDQFNCFWSIDDSHKSQWYYQHEGRLSGYHYARLRKAQMNVCNGSALSAAEIMQLHFDNDVEEARREKH